MQYAKEDLKTKQAYEEFIRVMVYDKSAPSFEDAFSRFSQALNLVLPRLS
jgi:hypothetical protein